jgi:DNA-binding transcriptional regulator LsrR (DeoR family)
MPNITAGISAAQQGGWVSGVVTDEDTALKLLRD